MGMHLGSGGHENTVKTHKNGELNFHLKGGSRQGPTKQSRAFPAEGSHREASLRHFLAQPIWSLAQTAAGVLLIVVW